MRFQKMQTHTGMHRHLPWNLAVPWLVIQIQTQYQALTGTNVGSWPAGSAEPGLKITDRL